MASSTDFIRAIRTKDFLEAKEQFSAIIQDKMRAVLAREYQDAAKTFGSQRQTNTSNLRTEGLTINEDLSWSNFIEFYTYYNGTHLVNEIIGVIIGIGVWIALHAPGWISSLAKKYSAWIRESERAYKIYEMKKELSSEDIQRTVAAAKTVYAAFSPRIKAKITTVSKQLQSVDLTSEKGKQTAARLIVDLTDIIKSQGYDNPVSPGSGN